jgi:hypothetical protein
VLLVYFLTFLNSFFYKQCRVEGRREWPDFPAHIKACQQSAARRGYVYVFLCVRVFVRACVRARARACVFLRAVCVCVCI